MPLDVGQEVELVLDQILYQQLVQLLAARPQPLLVLPVTDDANDGTVAQRIRVLLDQGKRIVGLEVFQVVVHGQGK